jgi:hypothetical protein
LEKKGIHAQRASIHQLAVVDSPALAKSQPRDDQSRRTSEPGY